MVWNCLATFGLRLKLLLSAVSANDFAEAIVMCVCGLSVVDGPDVLRAHVNEALGDVAIDSRAEARVDFYTPFFID